MDEMNIAELGSVEENLRECLRHVDAPPGFTDRVMARVEARRPRPRRVPLPFLQPAWLAIAATLLVTIGCGEALRIHHQHQAQAAAEAELYRALQLTSHAMNEVETGFQQSSAGRYAMLWNGN